MKRSFFTVGLVALLCLFIGLPAAIGQNAKVRQTAKQVMDGIKASDNAIVRFGSDIKIPEGTTIKGDVVCLFGTIDLNGKIEGSAVSLFGKVKSGKNAVVTKDLVLMMSDQDPAGGIKAGGSLVDINPPGRAILLKIMNFWLKSLPVNILISLVSLVLLIWVFIKFVIPAIDPSVLTRNMAANSGKAFLYGVLASIAIDVTAFVLGLTVILSGTAIILMFFFCVLWLISFIPVAFWLGEKASTLFKSKFSNIGQFLAGVVVIILIKCIPILGSLALCVLGAIGFGVLIAQILKLKLAAK